MTALSPLRSWKNDSYPVNNDRNSSTLYALARIDKNSLDAIGNVGFSTALPSESTSSIRSALLIHYDEIKFTSLPARVELFLATLTLSIDWLSSIDFAASAIFVDCEIAGNGLYLDLDKSTPELEAELFNFLSLLLSFIAAPSELFVVVCRDSRFDFSYASFRML